MKATSVTLLPTSRIASAIFLTCSSVISSTQSFQQPRARDQGQRDLGIGRERSDSFALNPDVEDLDRNGECHADGDPLEPKLRLSRHGAPRNHSASAPPLTSSITTTANTSTAIVMRPARRERSVSVADCAGRSANRGDVGGRSATWAGTALRIGSVIPGATIRRRRGECIALTQSAARRSPSGVHSRCLRTSQTAPMPPPRHRDSCVSKERRCVTSADSAPSSER